jgi:hypothetical protein
VPAGYPLEFIGEVTVAEQSRESNVRLHQRLLFSPC